jgi:hypothetical protein
MKTVSLKDGLLEETDPEVLAAAGEIWDRLTKGETT